MAWKKRLATDQKDREETEDELKATEELAGMNQAIDILTSDTAKGTFATAVDTFVQLGQHKTLQKKLHSTVTRRLTSMKSEVTPQMVAEVQTEAKAAERVKGHFD